MFEEYKQLLKEFIALQTVSSDGLQDSKEGAEWLTKVLRTYGFTVSLKDGYGNPFIFASYSVDPKAQTVLLYGHYDTQPAEMDEGWETDPFVLTEKNGKLFGRGVMDDKGQLLLHIVAIGKLIQEGSLGYNIKMLFEGEEEAGSPHIEAFVEDYAEELSCDFVFLSDGEMILGNPTLEVANRGLLNFTLKVQTAENELHSGIYGGAAPNAIQVLVDFIHGLFDEKHRITIDGFYDDVDVVDEAVGTPFDLEDYQKNTGAKEILTESGYDFHTATGQRPSLSVISIEGGYRGKGYKTTIPPVATAKFNIRLVSHQDPHTIAELFKRHVVSVMPSYVRYDMSFDEFAKPNKTDIHNSYVQKAEGILEKLTGKKSVYKYVGGTEPAISALSEVLQKPVVSVPFANEDGHMHGTNENFDIANIEKGLQFSQEFFRKEDSHVL